MTTIRQDSLLPNNKFVYRDDGKSFKNPRVLENTCQNSFPANNHITITHFHWSADQGGSRFCACFVLKAQLLQ